jgi:hypothetical protein
MKVDPNNIVLRLLVSKVLRLGEQKTYITGGIIRIGKNKINNNIIFLEGNT